MQESRDDTDHEEVQRHPSQGRVMPPPPTTTSTLGWLSHFPAVPLDQLPRAPTSFAFSTAGPTDGVSVENAIRPSFTSNEVLQLHNPAYAPPSTSIRRSIQPSPLLNDLSIINHPYGSPSTFPSWHSNLSTSRLPLVPQDVEYEQEYSIHQPPLPSTSRLENGHPNGHDLHHSDYVYPELDDFNINAPEDDPEAEVEIRTAPLEKDMSRKRTHADTDHHGTSVSGEQEGPKPKKARKSRSKAMANIDPQLEPPSQDEAGGPKKSRKETKNRGRPKGPKGPRPTLDPGPEFMALYNQAMDALIEQGDLIVAQTKVLEAIAVNPEIFAAHSLLADIHFAKGDHDKGLDALISGLHAHMNDVELWRQVADTILAGNQELPQKRVERAMYCFGAILRKEPTDMDARFQRAECARILGHVNRAFSDLQILLQHDPHNSSVLAQFTKLCSDVEEPQKARLLYEDHFDYYRINGISEEDSFSWQDVGVYVDLITQAGEHGLAIIMLKRLSRWLCGRQEESFWEEYLEDDREFDQTTYPRRLEVPHFEPNKFLEREYGEALPLDLRAKLGILRLKLNYREEAQSHFDWLEPDLDEEDSLVEEYSDAFLEIAKALYDAKEHKEALRFYDALKESGLDLSFEFWMGLGACAYVCEQKEKAIKAYQQALTVNPDSIDARTQLAKLYRDLGDRQNALKYGREAVVLSQDAIPQTGNRKYENRENRLLREAAERALKGAYRLPTGPRGAPGKVPDSLKYRTRLKSKFAKYVPRDSPDPDSGLTADKDDDHGVRWPNGRLKKFGPHNRPGRRKQSPKPKPPKAPKEPKQPRVRQQEKSKSSKQADVVEEAADSEEVSTPVVGETTATPEIEEQQSTSQASEIGKQTAKRHYRKRPSKIDPEKRYQDVQALFMNLLEYQSDMRQGDEEATSQWMDCAQALIDDFRTVKEFFPGERHAKFRGLVGPNTGGRPASAKPAPEQHAPTTEQTSETNPQEIPIVNDPFRSSTPVRMVDEGVRNDYCGVPFPTWLDIFLELALVTASSPVFQSSTGDLQTDCYTIINAAIDCNVFYHHAPSLTQIYVVYLSCCLALNDDVTLYNTVLRWFMNEFTFCTDTYRLYSTVALLGEYSNMDGKSRIEGSMYRNSSNQKFLFRQLCSIDQQLPKDYGIGTRYGPVPGFMRRERDGLRAQKGKKGTDLVGDTMVAQSEARGNLDRTPDIVTRRVNPIPEGTPTMLRYDRLSNMVAIKSFSPKEMDVVLFILYSHIMMANNSFTNALNYLYRAHSLDPTNTVCLLSMAFCYLTELFKRQVGNRHALSLMGWMWFGRYETERRKWAEHIDEENEFDEQLALEEGGVVQGEKMKMINIVNREIEFNRARCWEMLGMPDLAVRGYKKMLSLPGVKRENMLNEAAYDESDDEEQPETWDMEAAYAMSTIYMINGDGQMAREIVEKYMVVE